MNQTFENAFHVGCNYWASHAGCWMWRQWNEAIVTADLDALVAHGLTTLRVFPLWPDFQPLRVLSGAYGEAEHVGLKEGVQTTPAFERAGIDATMMARFARFCELAEDRGIQLTVMLLTGWMSGGQFRPDPLINRNLFTDPFALRWQVRFVKCFVEHFRSVPAIKAWGLGNECNIMSPCTSADAAYVWSSLITDAIRSMDPTRPVISGMHGLTLSAPENSWRIEDQGETCDILTTHPYPLFIRYCQDEPLNSFRNTLLPVCESTLYADLSGKPCFCEEVSDFGRNISSEEGARIYAQTLLWSCWANDNLGCLWWCGFDLDQVKQFPYDRYVFEQGLGVLTSDRQPKGVALAYKQFAEMLNVLPPEYRRLKRRRRDAVCILTPGQDTWAVALAAFMLARQVGFDVQFVDGRRPLPEARMYMLPCVAGYAPLASESWEYLFEQVRDNGATLYASVLDGAIPELQRFAGLAVEGRVPWGGSAIARFVDNGREIPLHGVGGARSADSHGASQSQARSLKFITSAESAEVLAIDGDDRPIYTQNRLGRGTVFFLNYGLETALAQRPMSFEDPSADYTRFYRAFSERLVNDRAIRKSSDVPMLVLSEHNVSDERVVTVAVNHGSGRVVATLQVNPGIEAVRILSGSGAIDDAGQLTIEFDAGEAAVIEASQVVMPDIAADGDAKRCEWVSRSDGNNIQRLQNDKPALISSD